VKKEIFSLLLFYFWISKAYNSVVTENFPCSFNGLINILLSFLLPTFISYIAIFSLLRTNLWLALSIKLPLTVWDETWFLFAILKVCLLDQQLQQHLGRDIISWALNWTYWIRNVGGELSSLWFNKCFMWFWWTWKFENQISKT
jgi:hypothetical protein